MQPNTVEANKSPHQAIKKAGFTARGIRRDEHIFGAVDLMTAWVGHLDTFLWHVACLPFIRIRSAVEKALNKLLYEPAHQNFSGHKAVINSGYDFSSMLFRIFNKYTSYTHITLKAIVS